MLRLFPALLLLSCASVNGPLLPVPPERAELHLLEQRLQTCMATARDQFDQVVCFKASESRCRSSGRTPDCAEDDLHIQPQKFARGGP